MLSLSRVSQYQGQNYYSHENYYSVENSIKNSEWQGLGAECFGLKGKIDAKVFQDLLAGRSPDNNIRLNCEHDNSGTKRRAGIDLTFSAPKSLSIAALVGGDSRLELAHKQAVTMALQVAEERYSVTRVGNKNVRQNEITGNIIAAKFQHDTSRAKDPQLHTHCVLINAVKRKDGEWRSLHNDEFFSNSKLLGLVYQNDLAARVKKLGYEVEKQANGTFEIKGYSDEQLRAFSKRRVKIEELGAENQKEARNLVKIDRPAKGKELEREELQLRWNLESQNLNITHPVAQKLALKNVEALSVDPADAVVSASRHVTEKDVSFKREKLEAFALENNLGSLDWQSLQREIFKQTAARKLIPYAPNRYTTAESLQTEKNILSLAQAGASKFAPIVEAIPKSLSENAWGLNPGQLEAVQLALNSRDQFMLWHGVAGAGKTYAMNVVREVGAEHQILLRGFAPSAEAAKVLEIEAKIPAQTVASLLTNPRRRQLSETKEVWIVDEAGLLSANDAAKLMQRAKEQEARIVFVGDTRQLSAVEAGNPFKLLRDNGVKSAELTESRRQKNIVLKTSVDLMAKGQQLQALQAIAAQIVEKKREANRIDFITKEFAKLRIAERENTLILAGTNKERELLTEKIREVLKTEKAIKEASSVTTLHAKDLSKEELANAAKMQVGEFLVFHKQAKDHSIHKGDKYQIVAIDSERNNLTISNNKSEVTLNPNRHKNSFLVYEAKQLEVCQGEKLRWTKNDKKLGVRNGEECTLDTFFADILQLKNKAGNKITISKTDSLHLDHNYVNTVFSSQGKTCDRVIISVDKTFGREAIYVALSRAKHDAQIVTPDKDDLMNIVSQSKVKLSALELVPEAKMAQEISQTKQSHANKHGHKL